jgi:hypothetical protein
VVDKLFYQFQSWGYSYTNVKYFMLLIACRSLIWIFKPY